MSLRTPLLAIILVTLGCDHAEQPAAVAEVASAAPVPGAAPGTPVHAAAVPSAPPSTPAAAIPAEPTPAPTYANTLRGSCEHYVDCKCESFTVPECVDAMTEQTGGQRLPASLYSCLNGLSCDDLCSDTSPGVGRCTEAASAEIIARTQAAARAQAAAHETTMDIIGNMGTTCPPGQRLVNGSCVSY